MMEYPTIFGTYHKYPCWSDAIFTICQISMFLRWRTIFDQILAAMLKLMLPISPFQTWFDSEKDMHRIMMVIMYDDADNKDDSDDDTDDDDSVNFNFRADHRAHIVKVV